MSKCFRNNSTTSITTIFVSILFCCPAGVLSQGTVVVEFSTSAEETVKQKGQEIAGLLGHGYEIYETVATSDGPAGAASVDYKWTLKRADELANATTLWQRKRSFSKPDDCVILTFKNSKAVSDGLKTMGNQIAYHLNIGYEIAETVATSLRGGSVEYKWILKQSERMRNLFTMEQRVKTAIFGHPNHSVELVKLNGTLVKKSASDVKEVLKSLKNDGYQIETELWTPRGKNEFEKLWVLMKIN